MVDVRTNSMKQVNDVIDAILSMLGNEEMAKRFSWIYNIIKIGKN